MFTMNTTRLNFTEELYPEKMEDPQSKQKITSKNSEIAQSRTKTETILWFLLILVDDGVWTWVWDGGGGLKPQ